MLSIDMFYQTKDIRESLKHGFDTGMEMLQSMPGLSRAEGYLTGLDGSYSFSAGFPETILQPFASNGIPAEGSPLNEAWKACETNNCNLLTIAGREYWMQSLSFSEPGSQPENILILVYDSSEKEAGRFAGQLLHQKLREAAQQHKQFSALAETVRFAFSLVNNLAIGVLVMDAEEKIHWANDSACRALLTNRNALAGRPIAAWFPDWHQVKKKLSEGVPYHDVESQFSGDWGKEKFLFNAYALGDSGEGPLGYMLTFREYRKILNLVNRYTGSQARFSFEDIMALNPAMVRLLDYAKKIADSPSSVLITGESGTGKEVFAQAIHTASSRRDSGFIAINCGAISPTLIESELFGYEEGAFTGARKGGRPGKFELADKGTLFLDEIGEMPPEMQVKLLRAIQEGRITRIGASKEIAVDVRIIAATNKNPQDEIRAGRFRSDLYYRLNVIPVYLPPLRDRKEDIKPLFRLFLKQKAAILNRKLPYISPGIIDKIQNYSWPGNIRELENYAEKAVLLAGSIPEPGWKTESTEKNPEPFREPSLNIQSLEEMEVEAIRNAIRHSGNNMTQAARWLGISRNTLYMKIQKYNLQQDRPIL